MKTNITLILLFCTVTLHAQKQGQAKIDSLLAELAIQGDDTNKVLTLHAIAYTYTQINPKEGLKYANQQLQLAEKIQWKKGIARAYSSIAANDLMMGNYAESLKHQAISIANYRTIYDTAGWARGLLNTGIAYSRMSDYPRALDHYFKALKLYEVLKSPEAAGIYGNIAHVYKTQKEYARAREYATSSLKLSQRTGNKTAIANNLYILGSIFQEEGNYPAALNYYNKVLEIYLELQSVRNTLGCYVSMAAVFTLQGDHERSLEYFRKGLNLAKQMGGKYEIANCYGGLGAAFLEMAKSTSFKGSMSRPQLLRLSRQYNDSAIAILAVIGELNGLMTCTKSLSDASVLSGDYQAAYRHFKFYSELKDSLFNLEKDKKLTQSAMQYEFEKKEAADKAKHDQEVAVAHAEIQKQRVIRNSSIAGTSMMVLFVGFALYNTRRRRRLEKSKAVSDERLRISRELHDDVGSALGSIALYSDVAITRSLKKESTHDVLLKIGNASRELVEKMSDIIWSMNPGNESTEKLLQRMKAFASMLLTPMKTETTFDFDDSLKEMPLGSDSMKNIFLIFKEAVYNISKYAGCKNVQIGFRQQEKEVVLTIQDDGKGFDAGALLSAYNGNGIKNMQVRAASLRARLDIRSQPNEGTTVTLALPKDRE